MLFTVAKVNQGAQYKWVKLWNLDILDYQVLIYKKINFVTTYRGLEGDKPSKIMQKVKEYCMISLRGVI